MTTKTSYTVPCTSGFRDAVEALARRRGCNAADLARSVVLLVPEAVVQSVPDPGGPPAGDRETVTPDGRCWRRKPRIQVRMPAGLDSPTIRRALALALALDEGRAALDLDAAAIGGAELVSPKRQAQENEIERLRASVDILAFEPLPGGINDRADALYILGFPYWADPSRDELRARFRVLATVHHPDGPHGSHRRMTQLNDAMAVLRNG